MNNHYVYAITTRGLKLLFTVSSDSSSTRNGWTTFYKTETEVVPHWFYEDETIKTDRPVLSTRLPDHCIISTTEI